MTHSDPRQRAEMIGDTISDDDFEKLIERAMEIEEQEPIGERGNKVSGEFVVGDESPFLQPEVPLDWMKRLKPGLRKKLLNPKTALDSLYPVSDRIKELHPDLAAIGIKSRLTPVKEVQCGITGPVVIAAVATKIATRDANDLAKVAKRGRKVSGPSAYLNMFLRDDSDEIYCMIDRFDFDRLAREIVERGKAGKAIYAVKGSVPPNFRMIKVQRIMYLGAMI